MAFMAKKAEAASSSEARTTPTPAMVTAVLPRRLPSRPLKAAPSRGRIGMSQKYLFIASSLLQAGGPVRVGGIPVTVEADDQRQADGRLAGGHGDDEEVEHHGLGIAAA